MRGWRLEGSVCVVLAMACGGGGTTDDGADGADGDGTAGDDGDGDGGGTAGDGNDGDGDGDGGTADDGADDGAAGERPNWHQDIAPFVAAHCGGCHTEGGIGTFSMDTYEDTMPYGGLMLAYVEQGLMPPWHAVETEECQPPHAFKHDARLEPDEIQLLRDLNELGLPEGDQALAAPIPPAASLDLADPTVTVTMNGSIPVEAQGTKLDYFHCLSFDPGNDQDVFVDGLQVIPGNERIVHHVLVFVDTAQASASWSDGISLNCGGGAGIDAAQLVGGWVPGGLPIETPEGVGVRLPAGARLIFNVHYHANILGPEVDEGTGLALRFGTATPAYVAEFALIGAPGAGSLTTAPFVIEPGAAGHQEVIEYAVPSLQGADVRVWSVTNHMHKVGVDMKTSLVRGGDETCLVQTPFWDFDWQRLYAYDVPIGEVVQLQDGDVVRVRCTYDNTLDNPAVVEALEEVGLDQPQRVELGEETLDEMCLAGVGFAIRSF
jgi:hypothetical protein